jgi:hypothetical protein
MKKLMTIAAAALCSTVMADAVESANIVGYSQQTANATRNTMMAPTFLNAESATGCKLSDLSVTGYDAPVWMEEDEYFEGGCAGGQFVLQFLNNNGSVAARYYWIDDGDNAAGWYASAVADAIEGGASSVTIPAGTAAWTLGSGKKLQSAGAVNNSDVAFKMNASRNTAAGNCMPVDLKLSQLTVTGYDAPEWMEEDEYFEGGCAGGQFVLQFLNNDGSVAGRYYWIDDGDNAAGWYASAVADAIEGGAEAVNIPAGKGAWVIGSGKVLNIPAPTL